MMQPQYGKYRVALVREENIKKELNEIAYGLYGLTNEEVNIIEH